MNIPFLESYKSCKLTISNAKKHIVLSILIFIFGIIIGYTYFHGSKILYTSFLSLVRKIYSDYYLLVVSNIFFHNIIIAYLSLRIGVLLGIFPFINVLITGAMIGWLFANIPIGYHFKAFAMLIPHGVFELPAMFLSSGVGMWRIRLLYVPNYEKASKDNVQEIHKLFLFIIFPLLLVAAFIEGIPFLF